MYDFHELLLVYSRERKKREKESRVSYFQTSSATFYVSLLSFPAPSKIRGFLSLDFPVYNY